MSSKSLDTPENPAETMRDVMAEIGLHTDITTPDGMDLTQSHIIAMPEKRHIDDLTDTYRRNAQFLKPARRMGTAELADLQSLINWANRFKGDTSVLFAGPDMRQPSLMCIADYHAAGPIDVTNVMGDDSARHCHHRALYNFPLSDEWQAWMGISGKPLEKDDLGEFIEANAKDIMDPTPGVIAGLETPENADWENRLIRTARQIEGQYGQLTRLLAMSKQFQVHETSNLTVATNRDTGESEIQFLNEHKDANGQPLKIPNLIIIAIPVFQGGAPYRMPVRFRYRKRSGSVSFTLSLYTPEKTFRAAFDEAVSAATEATTLPTFIGNPEK